jgi:alanyl aminopeptidase
MRRLFVLQILLFTASVSAETIRLGSDVVPKAERVELKLDPRSDSYSGTVTIDLDVKKPAASFRMHSQEIEISSVTLNGKAATFETGEQGTIVIKPERRLDRGAATLVIDFTNEYNRQAVGLYKMVKDGEPYLYTQFEAIDGRRAFPMWDEPAFKIPFQLTITAPAQYIVVANTPIASAKPDGEWKTTRFGRTRPLPSYLVALAVGQFDVVDIPGMRIAGQVFTPKGQGRLTTIHVENTPKILAALEKYFGSPYPFEKVGYIAVPEYWFGAMENPGAITFLDTIILLDEKLANPAQRRNVARVNAHELAHMWFGDLVTMKWWDDFWLNESFADWMGDKITDAVYPEFNLGISELQGIQNVMNTDARATTDAIRKRNAEPEDAMRNVGIAYDKGKAVLGMFEMWIGQEKFRQGVLEYLKNNAWGNATSDDLWQALGKHAPKGTVEALESFIDQPGVPLVSVMASGSKDLVLTQRRFAPAGTELKAQMWKIPVTVRYSDGQTTRTASILLDAPSKTLKLEGERVDWVYPHADARGYYRWQLPEAQLTALARQASDVLTPAERLSFVGNLGALLRAGALPGNTYLETLARLANDTHPQVISSVSTAMSQVEAAFVTPETRDEFAVLTRRTFGPALERIGYGAKPGEDPSVTILRPTLLRWLGETGQDPQVMQFAREQAAKYLADPTSVDPSIVSTVLVLNAMGGDDALFEEYRTRFEGAKTPAERGRFLTALGAFRDPAIRLKALDYALKGPMRPQEIFTIPSGGGGTEKEREETFRWVIANYDFIASKLPPQFLANMPFIGAGCEPTRLARTREFFTTHKVEGADRTLERVAEMVNQCVALRAREIAAVSSYLKETGR